MFSLHIMTPWHECVFRVTGPLSCLWGNPPVTDAFITQADRTAHIRYLKKHGPATDFINNFPSQLQFDEIIGWSTPHYNTAIATKNCTWQLCCRGMCKTLLRYDGQDWNHTQTISTDLELWWKIVIEMSPWYGRRLAICTRSMRHSNILCRLLHVGESYEMDQLQSPGPIWTACGQFIATRSKKWPIFADGVYRWIWVCFDWNSQRVQYKMPDIFFSGGHCPENIQHVHGRHIRETHEVIKTQILHRNDVST